MAMEEDIKKLGQREFVSTRGLRLVPVRTGRDTCCLSFPLDVALFDFCFVLGCRRSSLLGGYFESVSRPWRQRSYAAHVLQNNGFR